MSKARRMPRAEQRAAVRSGVLEVQTALRVFPRGNRRSRTTTTTTKEAKQDAQHVPGRAHDTVVQGTAAGATPLGLNPGSAASWLCRLRQVP